jgi:hypothetical protein
VWSARCGGDILVRNLGGLAECTRAYRFLLRATFLEGYFLEDYRAYYTRVCSTTYRNKQRSSIPPLEGGLIAQQKQNPQKNCSAVVFHFKYNRPQQLCGRFVINKVHHHHFPMGR